MPYETRIEVRLSEEEKKLIEEAAWIRRESKSAWARTVLLANARKTVEGANGRRS